MDREAFKEELLELLEDDELMANGEADEVIYEIDDIKVYGGFECGSRGIDHNILINKDVDWEDIINWGTVVVPESMTYISDEPIEEYEDMGYENLPIDNNHIMGYKSNIAFDNDFDMEL